MLFWRYAGPLVRRLWSGRLTRSRADGGPQPWGLSVRDATRGHGVVASRGGRESGMGLEGVWSFLVL